MSEITVLGGGYVGLVSGACFARLGHEVTVVEASPAKLKALRRDELPVREPGLAELWAHNRGLGRLRVTGDYGEALENCSFVFVAVGTPPRSSGDADLGQVLAATSALAANLHRNDPPTVVVKSTVPLGTAELIANLLRQRLPNNAPEVVSNPEFLSEGQAVLDFLRPTRVLIGAFNREAGERVAALYRPLRRPVVFCSPRTAEMVKYASNAFLCTKISFINEIALLCEKAGIDVVDVAKTLGLDNRIGHSYLSAGLGWGGSCLPKDIQSLIWTGARLGASMPMLRSAVTVNKRQPRLVLSKLTSLLGSLRGKSIAVWGLAFKPNCDDVRNSPALALIRLLLAEQCAVRAYDPLAMAPASREFPEITYCQDPYEAAAGSDAIVVATYWADFGAIDMDELRSRVARPIIIDARNALDPKRAADAGFVYAGIGRPLEIMGTAREAQPDVPRPGSRRLRASILSATESSSPLPQAEA